MLPTSEKLQMVSYHGSAQIQHLKQLGQFSSAFEPVRKIVTVLTLFVLLCPSFTASGEWLWSSYLYGSQISCLNTTSALSSSTHDRTLFLLLTHSGVVLPSSSDLLVVQILSSLPKSLPMLIHEDKKCCHDPPIYKNLCTLVCEE